jgi:4-aminobutyrate---pyruvate transaminase
MAPVSDKNEPGKKKSASSMAERDLASLIHPYTDLSKHQKNGPLVICRGEGIRVFDQNGEAYIEGMAGLWCTALGFSEERLVEAAHRQLSKLPFYHTFGGKAADVTIELAARLLEIAPAPMSKVFFANSGSEATDTAIKLVRYYNNAVGRPGKKKIIARHGAYHGVTLASASLTGLGPCHNAFDLPIETILHTDCPDYYRFGLEGESEETFSTRLVKNLDEMIIKEGADTIAAFIAEPVMGAGGVIVPPATYFEKIQAVLKKHDVLFIVDEVISGFGRTGNMWGCETFALKPDMIATAKGLSSAYAPISALLVSEPIYQAMVQKSGEIGIFGHGFTYSGHPVSAAVALETLNIYQERDIVAKARRVGGHLQQGLQKFSDHPLVGNVRGVGLVGAIEIVKDKESHTSFEPTSAVGPYLVKQAQAHGLIVRALKDVIAFSPPLIITEEEVDDMLDRFSRALGDLDDLIKNR